jgi:hypothetical protein
MAQYDVFSNPSRSAAEGIPYVVVVQSDLLEPARSKHQQETLLKGSDLDKKTYRQGGSFTWKSTSAGPSGPRAWTRL